MRTWKKILTIMILLCLTTITFFACGKKDPYADLEIKVVEIIGLENNTYTLTNQSGENSFTLKLTITGVDDDISKEISVTSSNNGLVSISDVNFDGESGITTVVCSFNIVSGIDTIKFY